MGADEEGSEAGGRERSKQGCWQRLREMHRRARANHKPSRLGDGLLTVMVVCREPGEGYSTWAMSEEIEKQNCNSTPAVNVV